MFKYYFGLKLWSSNKELVNGAEELIKKKIFDYIELQIVPNTDLEIFKKLKALYIIHSTTENHGFNIADNNLLKKNHLFLNQLLHVTKELKSKYLIIHPGFGEFEHTDIFLKKVNDNRVQIENMPQIGLNNEKLIGFSIKQITKLLNKRFGLCLDFNHAMKASSALKIDYKKYIEDLCLLKPKICHISDGFLEELKDRHLNIGEGNYDLRFFSQCIKKYNIQYITLETPRKNLFSLNEDLENIQKLKSIMSLDEF